ncbi:calycin-like domain-containing protein [Dysgonomonas reticulitermitis]
MNKKIINLFLAFSLSFFVFTACSSDDDANLVLENTEVTVELGGTATVNIKEGNGDYKVTPADATVATATVANKVITVTGVKAGETTLTVKDKENKTATLKVKVVTLSEKIAATYNGDLTVTLPGQTPATDKKDIVLATSGENVKLTLAGFSFAGQSVGDIVVDGISVARAEGAISLKETEATVSLNLPGLETPTSVKVKVSGTVQNKPKKANMPVATEQVLDLTITVTEVPGMDNIAVKFSGAKKAS